MAAVPAITVLTAMAVEAAETISGNNGGRGVPGAGLLAMRFLLVSISMLFVTIGVAYHERAKARRRIGSISTCHICYG